MTLCDCSVVKEHDFYVCESFYFHLGIIERLCTCAIEVRLSFAVAGEKHCPSIDLQLFQLLTLLPIYIFMYLSQIIVSWQPSSVHHHKQNSFLHKKLLPFLLSKKVLIF